MAVVKLSVEVILVLCIGEGSGAEFHCNSPEKGSDLLSSLPSGKVAAAAEQVNRWIVLSATNSVYCQIQNPA